MTNANLKRRNDYAQRRLVELSAPTLERAEFVPARTIMEAGARLARQIRIEHERVGLLRRSCGGSGRTVDASAYHYDSRATQPAR
jgi:hypothetical protein